MTCVIMFPEEEINETNILSIFVGIVILNLFKNLQKHI